MEWVETTGKTIEEAKDLALDQLGVAADEAEFEVVEEPRTGLFGRFEVEARVRARVKPAPCARSRNAAIAGAASRRATARESSIAGRKGPSGRAAAMTTESGRRRHDDSRRRARALTADATSASKNSHAPERPS